MPQSRPTLALFPSPSRSGADLQKMIVDEAESLGFSATVFGPGRTQRDCLFACLCDDVVVIDATPEPENTATYRIMTEQPNGFWHVLVVSRSYLPINFKGLRSGGAPVVATDLLASSDWQKISLSPRRLRAAAQEKKVLSIGHEKVRISEQPPRYIWHGSRSPGNKIGFLQELPTFVTVPVGKPA